MLYHILLCISAKQRLHPSLLRTLSSLHCHIHTISQSLFLMPKANEIPHSSERAFSQNYLRCCSQRLCRFLLATSYIDAIDVTDLEVLASDVIKSGINCVPIKFYVCRRQDNDYNISVFCSNTLLNILPLLTPSTADR